MEYELHADARGEFLLAADWYDAEVPGLGTRFVAEIERCLELLAQRPSIGSPYGRRLRRFVVDDAFPYPLAYAVRGDVIFVVAVAHHSRRPGYWRYRAAR